MKYLRIIGVLSAVSAYPFIAVSIALSPWFDFRNNALSDLGNVAQNVPISYVFNSGLVLSGLLTVSFALLVSLKNRSWKYLSWSLLLMVAGVSLALIGVFPEDAGIIHRLVSTAFFLSLIAVMLAYSFCSWMLKKHITGIIALLFSISSALVWALEWGWRGVAIQETATSLMATIWLIIVSMKEFDNDSSVKKLKMI